MSRVVYAYWFDWYDEYVARINQSIENIHSKKMAVYGGTLWLDFPGYGHFLECSQNKTTIIVL